MKVLHLLSTSKWTGAAEPVFLLCRELIRRGHDVRLAFPRPFRGWRLSSKQLRQGKVHVWIDQTASSGDRPALEQRADAMGIPTCPELRLHIYPNLRHNLNDFWALRRLVRRERLDLLHCHLPHAYYLGALARPAEGYRLVYSHHPPKPMRRDPWHRWLVHRRTDHILTYSPEVADAYGEVFKVPKDKLTLLRGGIDLEAYRAGLSGEAIRDKWNVPKNFLLLGMVARMQERRDHATLLQAIARLGASSGQLRCLLIGRGEHRATLQSLAAGLGIADQVIFAGYLEKDYLEGLAAIDVFVYTAPGSDASCRAVIEAMAMGKPVIGVRQAAVPLLVEPGQTGFLFDPGNAEQLAKKIQLFQQSPQLATQLGQEGRRKAESELTTARLAQAVEEVYQRLVTVREARPHLP